MTAIAFIALNAAARKKHDNNKKTKKNKHKNRQTGNGNKRTITKNVTTALTNKRDDCWDDADGTDSDDAA